MCHGYIDPRFLMRETEDRLKDAARVPAPETAPRPSLVPELVPSLVAALRRLFARPQQERETIVAE